MQIVNQVTRDYRQHEQEHWRIYVLVHTPGFEPIYLKYGRN